MGNTIIFIVALIVNMKTHAELSFDEHTACLQNAEQDYALSSERLIQAYELAKIIPHEFENSRSTLIEERVKALNDCASFLPTQVPANFAEVLERQSRNQSTRGIASIDNAPLELTADDNGYDEASDEASSRSIGTIVERNGDIIYIYNDHRVRIGY